MMQCKWRLPLSTRFRITFEHKLRSVVVAVVVVPYIVEISPDFSRAKEAMSEGGVGGWRVRGLGWGDGDNSIVVNS